jgi:hypothetical protein
MNCENENMLAEAGSWQHSPHFSKQGRMMRTVLQPAATARHCTGRLQEQVPMYMWKVKWAWYWSYTHTHSHTHTHTCCCYMHCHLDCC